MKYRMSLLADNQAIKTICITRVSEVGELGRRSTHLMRYFDTDTVSHRHDLITVVIRGQELSLPFVQSLVSTFFSHTGKKRAQILEMND